MRPSASLCQSSRYRLLTLLLVLLLGIPCAQTVAGFHSAAAPNLGIQGLLTKPHLVGGTPLERNYHLISQCRAYVQITPRRGSRAINARGNASSDFALLTFESHSPTELKIVGFKSRKYLCFSRKGRLIARFSGNSKRCLFHEREKGGYIMLQSAANADWYVGFNKRGNGKRGYTFPKDGEARSPTRPNSRRRDKKRAKQQDVNKHGNKRKHRHDHGSSPSARRGASRNRGQRLRGRVRRPRDRTVCFQFTMRRTDRDRSDPRVKNSLAKEIHDPWKNTDLGKYISTPDPR
ncbi:uncharacterized protein LOC143293409 [Babylonia areolata]|uniref:uncharacterized protein LOC143293409 n=1 Tax=Babylonia areolata TaxID=304850 RepID=UPI003FD2573C